MTEHEICILYRNAANQTLQVQILSELTCMSKVEIVGILVRNGEKIPERIINQLFKRLDELDAQISKCEKEYREIVAAIKGKQEE